MLILFRWVSFYSLDAGLSTRSTFYLDIYSVSSLIQHYTDKLITQREHVILTLNKPNFAISHEYCVRSVDTVKTNNNLLFDLTGYRTHTIALSG